MITEDYLDFETAKLLKEKGFDVNCYCHYSSDGRIQHWNYQTPSDGIPCPTLQMAMKWLREEKHIFIRIIQSNIEYCACEIYFDRVRCHQFRESFTSYEDAVETAIKYCLEKLI
jgi:hypothetical protein